MKAFSFEPLQQPVPSKQQLVSAQQAPECDVVEQAAVFRTNSMCHKHHLMVVGSLGLIRSTKEKKNQEDFQALGTCIDTLLVEPVLLIDVTDGCLVSNVFTTSNDTLMRVSAAAATVTIFGGIE